MEAYPWQGAILNSPVSPALDHTLPKSLFDPPHNPNTCLLTARQAGILLRTPKFTPEHELFPTKAQGEIPHSTQGSKGNHDSATSLLDLGSYGLLHHGRLPRPLGCCTMVSCRPPWVAVPLLLLIFYVLQLCGLRLLYFYYYCFPETASP